MYASDAHHKRPSLQQKLESIYELRGGPTIDLTIRPPYRELLEKLGNPHQSLPPVIHVAGTNGKGSVIAMLRSIFESAGYRVHAYTSPHLVRFNERILLAGEEISDQLLESLLDEVLALNGDGALTFFEVTTALALKAFAQTPADICLLETGLGGRLDCTNVVNKPAATIITRIGYDHTEFLGDTLEKIMSEKAGIMKEGAPCIIAPQENQEIENFAAAIAAQKKAPFYKTQRTSKLIKTNLFGEHQQDNIATALNCLQQISGFNVTQKSIETGLQSVHWPARLQQINHGDLPEDCELWIDGGHNESAANILATQAKRWAQQDNKKLHIILGMMKNKAPETFVNPLIPYTDQLTCISIPSETMMNGAEELKNKLTELNISVLNHTDEAIKDAIKAAAKPNTRILITGSLYLAGHVLGQLKK